MAVYEVKRRRGASVERFPNHPTFKSEDEARRWAEAHSELFPVGISAIEIVTLGERYA